MCSAYYLISEFELASRLSYFLWSSMPDDELLELAEKSGLRKPGALERQIRRMLEDSKSRALAENFAGQWLQVRNLELLKPDPARFPEFNEDLRDAMLRETELFFNAVVQEDRSILDFLDGQFSFLNERLARHYGVTGVAGDDFRKVALQSDQRSGILTRAAVLTVSSYPTRTSPVLRGKWLLENILGAPPPPPPADVPNLKEEEIGTTGTLREQLEIHRANPACAVCHNRMDALGFALENYDAIGRWRTMEGEFPIDTGGTLPDGRSFDGPAEMRAILKADAKAFAECLVEKLMTYALGRGLKPFDKPTVRSIVEDVAGEDYRFSRLVIGIVNSDAFQMREARE